MKATRTKLPSKQGKALACILALGITAPTDAKAFECLRHAEEMADGMTRAEVKLAQALALKLSKNSDLLRKAIGGLK